MNLVQLTSQIRKSSSGHCRPEDKFENEREIYIRSVTDKCL